MNSMNAISIKSRFSRSVNVERDGGAHSLEGYIPTGRALDVVRRLAQGMLDPSAGRSLSITGPHGGGKSSLAIFVDALLSASKTPSYKAAFKLLEEFDPVLATMWEEARKCVDDIARKVCLQEGRIGYRKSHLHGKRCKATIHIIEF